MKKVQRVNDFQLSKHFNLKEFECKCCHTVKIRPEIIEKLQTMRSLIKAPIIITSGYRCLKHNIEVQGVNKSQHLHGLAVDIFPPHNKLDMLLDFVYMVGFREVIAKFEKGYIHCGLYETLKGDELFAEK